MLEGTLIAGAQFSAFGVDYMPGDVVDATDWPEGALERRLQNKSVETRFAVVADAAAPEDGDEPLEKKTKAELEALLAAQGVTVTGRETKAELLKLLGEG